jgi:hypothetical protein
MLARWKGIVEEIHFGGNIEGNSYFSPFSQKTSFRASKQASEMKNC